MKTILIAAAALVLYIIIGMLIPFVQMKPVSEAYREKVDVSRFYAEAGRTSSQRAYVVETNQEALDFRLDLFERARDRIVMSTFDIRPGKSTDDLFASLYAAADRGVKVQLVVDGMYGMLHMAKEDIFYAAGTHPNIEIRFYNQPNPLLPWTIHGRMHDKYILVDQEYLLMGGRNTFDYFIGEYTKSRGYDREVFVMGEPGEAGSAVIQADQYFQKMWKNKACRTVYDSCADGRMKDVSRETDRLKQHYADMKQKEKIPSLDYDALTVPIKKATFLHNPTHIYGKEPYIFEELRQLMLQAEDRVIVHTPYVVCSDAMYEGFSEISEAVPDSQMIVNSIASGDNICASSDYLRHRKDVLATGFQLYEYMGKHSTHGKSLVVDDNISVIGSYNFDNRSTYVDTETMLVIDSEELNAQLTEKFEDLKEISLEVGQDENYIEKGGVTPSKLDGNKSGVIKLLSVLIQGFRYLI